MEKNIKKIKEKEKQSNKQREIRSITNKRIQSNIIVAIILMLYFLVLSLTYQNLGEVIVLQALEVLSMIYLFIGIFVMERAYKKDSGELGIYSIEILVIAAHTLSIQYVVTKYDFSLPLYVTVSSYIFAIYYVFKSIIIYTKQRRKYLDTFSDIPEITKKEKPSVKEAKKRNKIKSDDVSTKKDNSMLKEERKQKVRIHSSEEEIKDDILKENNDRKTNNKKENVKRPNTKRKVPNNDNEQTQVIDMKTATKKSSTTKQVVAKSSKTKNAGTKKVATRNSATSSATKKASVKTAELKDENSRSSENSDVQKKVLEDVTKKSNAKSSGTKRQATKAKVAKTNKTEDVSKKSKSANVKTPSTDGNSVKTTTKKSNSTKNLTKTKKSDKKE